LQLVIEKLVDVELHLLPGVGGQVKDPRIHADCIFGAHFDAVAAVDAHAQVDVEADRILFDMRIGMLARHDRDAFGRADGLAEHAADATGRAVVAHGQPVAAAESRHERAELFGILNGGGGAQMQQTPQTVGDVEIEVAKEVPERDLQSAQNLGEVELLPEGQLGPLYDGYSCGHGGSPKKTSATAVTTTLTTAIGNSPIQPSRMSWS
jgi:hypothetical protein